MKRIKVLAVAAIIVAAGSAFATKDGPLAAGDYRSTKVDGQPCQSNALANRPECPGVAAICKIGSVTYYANANCTNPLRFP